MSIIEKVKLARLGNVDARSLLVRDRNKLVAAAAIRNPKITDSEIEGFARARNLCDEVMPHHLQQSPVDARATR